jgi:hypothetical protein
LNQKSGAKRIINKASVPMPFGSLEIYEKEDFFNTLTLLILKNPNILVWIFKIEDEAQSRGTAYFDRASLPEINTIITENSWDYTMQVKQKTIKNF